MPATAAQQWYQALTNLGISGLRIRSGTAADEMKIDQQGTKAAPAYKVTGILAADNMLHVPGGKFGVRDTGQLRKWLENLGDAGAEGVTAPRAAFGLTPSQLEQVHRDLQQPVAFSTAGKPANEVARQLTLRLQIPPAVDPGAAAALARVTIEDELQGLSSGTALAAVLRPAGLVLAPRRERGGELEYHIGRPSAGQEVWPVGWKPEKRASDQVPALFELVNVEITDTPVSDAAGAIAGRLKVPFVFDRNAMALHGANPAAAAEVPAKQMSYSQVLSKVLFPAGLRYELRVDENDKPFVWVTTIKPAP